MDIDVKNNISKHEFGVQNIENNIVSNRYELEITLEDKVYSKTYYSHQPRSSFVSLYSRFYEVIILGGTYATNEGKMQSASLDVKLHL